MFYSFNKLFKNYTDYKDVFLIIIKMFLNNYKEVFMSFSTFFIIMFYSLDKFFKSFQ